MLRKFQKRELEGLQKKVRLSAGSLYLRLALERSDYDIEKIDLDSYYEALQPILDERNRLYIWYGVAFGSLYFSYLGVLQDFSLLGIDLDPVIIKHFLLILLAILALQFSLVLARISRYVDLFSRIFNSSAGAKKQDLILRYPRIFSPLHFGSWMTGSPRHMYPSKNFPMRTALLLLLLVPAILLSFSFFVWLTGAVSYQLWFDDSEKLSGWSRPIVAACWAIFLATALVPTISLRKITFWHSGLGAILERFRLRDPVRYRHYLERVAEADERRGGTLFLPKEKR